MNLIEQLGGGWISNFPPISTTGKNRGRIRLLVVALIVTTSYLPIIIVIYQTVNYTVIFLDLIYPISVIRLDNVHNKSVEYEASKTSF